MDVGRRIRERRLELGLTLEDLGKRLGKNRSTIYRYENGEIENMPIDILKPIAEALQTTPAHLMGWDVDEIDTVAAEHEESMSDLASLDAIADAEERAKNIEQWRDSMGDVVFTDEEMAQLIDYAKFIISKRKE